MTSTPAPTLKRDPVCGMMVDPATAKATANHAGKTYYFCHLGCVEKFLRNPEQYLTPKSSAGGLVTLGVSAPRPVSENPPPSITPQTAYVCPMCAEVREEGPGPCWRCGMTLEPERPVFPTKTEYICPMHPQIVRPGPGACPICGMALEPRTFSVREEENPELRDMTRRFWLGVMLTIPLLAIAMAPMFGAMRLQHFLPVGWLEWVELLLATPVVLWGGLPFFQRGWAS